MCNFLFLLVVALNDDEGVVDPILSSDDNDPDKDDVNPVSDDEEEEADEC